jgi:hypothetical protein
VSTVPPPVASTGGPPTALLPGVPVVPVPGAFNRAVTQATIRSTICTKGWTATVRPPVSYTEPIKKRLAAAAGVTNLSAYELDHLVPLELGGAPSDPNNLWLQPWAGTYGATQKDLAESRLNHAVCSGTMTLDQARSLIVQPAQWHG